MIEIIGSDCSGLIPPCWQELHYLIAGMWAGWIVGLVLGVALCYYAYTRFVE